MAVSLPGRKIMYAYDDEYRLNRLRRRRWRQIGERLNQWSKSAGKPVNQRHALNVFSGSRAESWIVFGVGAKRGCLGEQQAGRKRNDGKQGRRDRDSAEERICEADQTRQKRVAS